MCVTEVETSQVFVNMAKATKANVVQRASMSQYVTTILFTSFPCIAVEDNITVYSVHNHVDRHKFAFVDAGLHSLLGYVLRTNNSLKG